MKLLTKALLKRFEQVGRQEGVEDPIVITKFFYPYANWTWYATEYDPENRMFFGLVYGIEKEWGYFSLDELSTARDRMGLSVERDLYWKEKKVSEINQYLGGIL